MTVPRELRASITHYNLGIVCASSIKARENRSTNILTQVLRPLHIWSAQDEVHKYFPHTVILLLNHLLRTDKIREARHYKLSFVLFCNLLSPTYCMHVTPESLVHDLIQLRRSRLWIYWKHRWIWTDVFIPLSLLIVSSASKSFPWGESWWRAPHWMRQTDPSQLSWMAETWHSCGDKVMVLNE